MNGLETGSFILKKRVRISIIKQGPIILYLNKSMRKMSELQEYFFLYFNPGECQIVFRTIMALTYISHQVLMFERVFRIGWWIHLKNQPQYAQDISPAFTSKRPLDRYCFLVQLFLLPFPFLSHSILSCKNWDLICFNANLWHNN